ncbi:MAG: phosphatase, partial [Pseudomonadota bacterium]
MKKSILALSVCAALTTMAYADAILVNGPMKFNPIAASAYQQTTTDPLILNSEPWVIPEGFTQHIVSDENNLDIYPDSVDWT